MRISALIPIRNGIRHLDNLRNDLELNLSEIHQIIFVNDGSNDGTKEYLMNWAKSENRIQLINTIGMGLVSALNTGVKECDGNWIARFDVDDRYYSSRIFEQVKYVENNVGAIFNDYEFISSKQKFLGYVPSGVLPSVVSLSLINSQRTAHPSALVNKEALIEVGGYRQSDFPVEDLSLWLRLSREFKLVSVPSPLLKYRLSKNSITRQNKDLIRTKRNEIFREFPIVKNAYTSSLANMQNILDLYKTLPYTQLRSVLLFKDVIKFENVYGEKRNNNFMLNYFFKNFLNEYELISPVYHKIVRDIYRFV